jgi:hypothetical protein
MARHTQARWPAAGAPAESGVSLAWPWPAWAARPHERHARDACCETVRRLAICPAKYLDTLDIVPLYYNGWRRLFLPRGGARRGLRLLTASDSARCCCRWPGLANLAFAVPLAGASIATARA